MQHGGGFEDGNGLSYLDMPPLTDQTPFSGFSELSQTCHLITLLVNVAVQHLVSTIREQANTNPAYSCDAV
jgi:hypothetical protein